MPSRLLHARPNLSLFAQQSVSLVPHKLRLVKDARVFKTTFHGG